MTKTPREATAALASTATSAAACWTTASAFAIDFNFIKPSVGTELPKKGCFLRSGLACKPCGFMAGWIVPSAHRCHLFDLPWSPGIRLILVNRRSHFEYRIDDAPCFLQVVLTRDSVASPSIAAPKTRS